MAFITEHAAIIDNFKAAFLFTPAGEERVEDTHHGAALAFADPDTKRIIIEELDRLPLDERVQKLAFLAVYGTNPGQDFVYDQTRGNENLSRIVRKKAARIIGVDEGGIASVWLILNAAKTRMSRATAGADGG